AIIGAFEGKKKQSVASPNPKHPNQADPADDWTGDVKYHLGARFPAGVHRMAVEVPMALAPNPSHLEQVNPVIEGMVRASQDVCDQAGDPVREDRASVALAIHGEAA